MITHILLLVLGFAVLIIGAHWLVDGGSALARKLKISELAIGLTIIAFGTSMPELVVNVFAASRAYSDIVFGNVIGSNVFNLLAILGLAGLISPLKVQESTAWKEIPLSFFAVLLLFVLSNAFLAQTAVLSRIDGFILLIFFCLFLYYVFTQMKGENIRVEVSHRQLTTLRISLLIVGGLVFLVAGGRLVVSYAVRIAEDIGISQTVIGLTIVAAGTSLPELATSVVAAVKRSNDIAVGNIVGSNIFNIFLILGVSSLVRPVEYSVKFNSSFYLLGVATIMLFLAMLTGKRQKLERWESGLMLLLYIGYTVFLVIREA